jgi:hypothetical protein
VLQLQCLVYCQAESATHRLQLIAAAIPSQSCLDRNPLSRTCVSILDFIIEHVRLNTIRLGVHLDRHLACDAARHSTAQHSTAQQGLMSAVTPTLYPPANKPRLSNWDLRWLQFCKMQYHDASFLGNMPAEGLLLSSGPALLLAPLHMMLVSFPCNAPADPLQCGADGILSSSLYVSYMRRNKSFPGCW